jgi:hypothetical protein
MKRPDLPGAPVILVSQGSHVYEPGFDISSSCVVEGQSVIEGKVSVMIRPFQRGKCNLYSRNSGGSNLRQVHEFPFRWFGRKSHLVRDARRGGITV